MPATGLDDRYGRASSAAPGRRLLLGVAGVLLATGVGWAGWAAFGQTNDGLSWTDLGYRVDGPASVSVTFEVGLPAGSSAVCTLRALNSGHAEVGLIDVPVGPAAAGTVRITGTVPTMELAVTGLVKGCAAGR